MSFAVYRQSSVLAAVLTRQLLSLVTVTSAFFSPCVQHSDYCGSGVLYGQFSHLLKNKAVVLKLQGLTGNGAYV